MAIPLFRSPELLSDLGDVLAAVADEIAALNGTVLFINDSPDDTSLNVALGDTIRRLRDVIAVERLDNPATLGFVRTANRAMKFALASERDVILLNSDALPRPGAFREMLEVAYSDPLIGVVSPRSDNATICNSPVWDSWRGADRDATYEAHLVLQRHLPRITYVPTAVGFCLLIKRLILAEFGYFDEGYGAGYNEENDLIRRCNQCGYRAVLANHAYVHHLGGISFAKTAETREIRDRRNHALLIERYPEYDRIVRRHFESVDFESERLLAGLIPVEGKVRVLFDCRVLAAFFNGTFEHLRCLLASFVSHHGDRFASAVLCDEEAFNFHKLGEIPGVEFVTLAAALQEPAAIAFRLSQPDDGCLTTLPALGAIVGSFMLDTIAMDCQQLDRADFSMLWQDAAETFDLIGFNSAFSADQFERRFAISERVVRFVSMCSTSVADYRGVQPGEDGGNGGILLIGNHYPHKHMRETCRALHRANSKMPIVAFGMALDEPGVVASYVAGHISEDIVERLYLQADVALFPSHYEGFGLPIMHALAKRLPVIARDIPCAREIKAHCAQGPNLHLFASTDEMVAAALDPPRWREENSAVSPITWEQSAAALAAAFESALKRFDFAACRQRRRRMMVRLGTTEQAEEADQRNNLLAALRKGIEFAHLEMAHQRDRLENAEATMRDDALRTARAEAIAKATISSARENHVLGQGGGGQRRRWWTLRSLVDGPAIVAGTRTVRIGLGRIGQGGLSDASLREHVVMIVRGLPVGTPLKLYVPGASYRSTNEAKRAGAALLRLAGCVPHDVYSGFRAVVARGVKTVPNVPLLETQDDDLFLELAYRLLLGREPEHRARAEHLATLAGGMMRGDLLDRIASSEERWATMLALGNLRTGT